VLQLKGPPVLRRCIVGKVHCGAERGRQGALRRCKGRADGVGVHTRVNQLRCHALLVSVRFSVNHSHQGMALSQCKAHGHLRHKDF
jgi:hypothetical protein